MAKVNIFKCDICKEETRYSSWEYAPTSLKCLMEGSGVQYRAEYTEVCYQCAETLCNVFAARLVELLKNK